LKWNPKRILVCLVSTVILSDMLSDIVRSFAEMRNLVISGEGVCNTVASQYNFDNVIVSNYG
jgi:hypothetical protein